MELNIVSFTYLFLRLAPFVLVSFFTLLSLFNQDFKGLVYLIGLLFACFLNIVIGNPINPYIQLYEPKSGPEICNMITLGENGESLSKLPLGQAVLGYTFAYLLVPIASNHYENQNIPTLVFFPLLILFDAIWNMKNSCYSFFQLFIALLIGGFFGWFWGYLVDESNNKSLQYFAATGNNDVCTKPSAQTFKCAVYKNGKLLKSNMTSPSE
jgi:hypothetical protein